MALLSAVPTAARAPEHYHTARASGYPSLPIPEGKRVPFGWRAAPVTHEGLSLRFPRSGSRLRITVALDSREPLRIKAESRRGEPIGEFDLRFSHLFELFEIPVNNIGKDVRLRLVEGAGPIWIFVAGAPTPLLPHMLEPGDLRPIDEFHRRLRGTESIQPFGWMSGCVLDGLVDLGYEDAVKKHLKLFIPEAGRLIYEDPRSRIADDRISGIESTLPFGHIAARYPDHPSIDRAVRFWLERRDEEGCVIDGTTTSAEGSYTVGWPMAAIARLRRDRELEDLAIRQLRLRQRRLSAPDAVHLRSHAGRGHTFRNWARGIAWYMLGLSRTLAVLRDREDVGDLRAEMRRVAEWALTLQTEDGLWCCFLDEPATGIETSGSAGIAASIAQAANLGLVSSEARVRAQHTLTSLERHLTPDGFLTGVAQSNRGGEELQRSGYRVLSQMGMGLMAQLIAAAKPMHSPAAA